MKIARAQSQHKLRSTLRLVAGLSLSAFCTGPVSAASVTVGIACIGAPLLGGALLLGCADENDPQTWVKRLDDPAQKPNAIKRLTQFFEDAMTKNNKNREAPPVKALLDKITEPLTKAYVAGNLDDKTRKELIKFLSDTRDPRTSPALAKALNDYDPGKNDEDVKAAAQSVKGMALDNKKVDQTVIDALWNVFGKWHASSQNAAFLARDLQDAIMALKDPSYAQKALDKISVPINPKNAADAADQAVWQLISTQLIGHLKFTAAVKQLAVVMLTPEKQQLQGAAVAALARMPKEAEPVLVSAVNGSDPTLKALADKIPEKAAVALVCDALATISRPQGRDACLAALGAADNVNNRTAIARTLYKYPADAKIVAAFRAAYDKTPNDAVSSLLGGGNARGLLARVASNYYDNALTDWLLKEITTAKGDKDTADALQMPALESAIKLYGPSQKGGVADAVNKEGTEREKSMNKLASAVVDKCKEDANCYVKVLDEPIQSNTGTANMTAVKAAWMAAVYGKDNAGVRNELAKRITKVSDPPTRLAIAQALMYMSPKGDDATATLLEKVVKDDEESGNKNMANADLGNVALTLRARSAQ